jgi:uncharacterized protein (DUF1697 family)
MSNRQVVALLRGINVGGRNIISMADLRATFEAERYAAVRTYIQSGNVLLESDTPSEELEADIEAMLTRRLGLPLVVVVRSDQALRDVVANAPDGFGAQPDRYHCDAVFLKAPLRSRQAMDAIELRDGVDRAWPGHGVLYFARLSARRAQSRMSRIVGTPEYQLMTVRSWRTTTRLLALIDEHADR